MIIPEAVHSYNVYNGTNRIIGITGAVELPGFQYITNSISLAGMPGEYDAPVLGHVASQKIKIPFTMIEQDGYFAMVKGGDDIVLRASIQTKEAETSKLGTIGMVVTIRGITTEYNLGSLEKAKLMNSDITKEITYIKIVIGNVVCLEYDKFNNIYVINGEDMLAKVRANL
ncbi:phage major tail tube protein [Anaerocolumna sp. AGMB13025]|uniref:phage major tail tube protein n=1 Tax=Anaerocolumna sp. AGMB13025 TaxID=3039116 RepID=UPI00241C6B8A|nr:phage major tail tube protein [Anaerocolumna sp. AGMB13025]WFR55356.1 phage major tail tube protein [Anaerocolumna sp. AGMB13025]